MQEISRLVELPKTSAAWDSVTDLKFLFWLCADMQMFVAVVWEGMENVHSETIVRHFITVFGFCMIIVSPNCK